MISVPSHRQLSNGSKVITLFLLVVIAFSSCKSKQILYPAPDINKPKPEIVTKPKDTKPKETDTKPQIPKDPVLETPQVIKKTGPQSSVNISLLVPFNAKSYYPGANKLPSESEKFLNFYQGFLLGVKKVNQSGLTTYLNVYDTKKSGDVFNEKLKRIRPDQTDIVVGAYQSGNIKLLAEWAKQNEVIAVSPWKSSAIVSTDNPYFFQVSPTLDLHYETIVDHIYTQHPGQKVVVVSRDKSKEKKLLDKVLKINEDKYPDAKEDFTSFVVPDNSEELTPELILASLNNRGTTVIILPYYNSEEFVQAFLARLSTAAVDKNIIVYGMPQWLEFGTISFGQLVNLQVRVPMHQHVNGTDYQIKTFNREYLNEYGMIPTDDEAYAGYDLAIFVGMGYKKFGIDFLYAMDGSTEKYSSMSISVDRNVPMSASGGELSSKINFFENKAMQLYQFNSDGLSRIK